MPPIEIIPIIFFDVIRFSEKFIILARLPNMTTKLCVNNKPKLYILQNFLITSEKSNSSKDYFEIFSLLKCHRNLLLIIGMAFIYGRRNIAKTSQVWSIK